MAEEIRVQVYNWVQYHYLHGVDELQHALDGILLGRFDNPEQHGLPPW